MGTEKVHFQDAAVTAVGAPVVADVERGVEGVTLDDAVAAAVAGAGTDATAAVEEAVNLVRGVGYGAAAAAAAAVAAVASRAKTTWTETAGGDSVAVVESCLAACKQRATPQRRRTGKEWPRSVEE